MRNIVLIGFMGSGKTTVGRILAQRTGSEFIDTDAYLEQQFKISISEYFARYGEQSFRAAENDAFRHLMTVQGRVIATGGGLPVFCTDKAAFNSAFTIYLEIDAKTVFSRLVNDTSRPLLSGDNGITRISELLEERAPVYRTLSNLTLNAALPPEKIAETIISVYNNLE